MKKLLFIALALQAMAMQAESIKGVVAAAKDKSPIEYAPVALLKLPDSAVVAGNSSQAGGQFAFNNVKPGKYYLRATYVGFAPVGKEIEVKTTDNNFSVDTLMMSETSKNIEEVVVKGEKIKGKELVDRTIYSIPGEVSKASPNAYDLLKKVPSIQVDYNDNITLNGNSNFIIQVDGKQRDKEFLARLQPTDIESIEVITNPSGKYEGNIDGVLNIKLKREARYGVSGNFNLAGRPSKQTSANIAGSVDYSMGNSTLYFSAFSFYNNLNSDHSNTNNMLLFDSLTRTKGVGTYKFLVGALNTGYDYFIDKNQTFSINVSYKPVFNRTQMDQNSTIFLTEIEKYTQTSSTDSKSLSHEINSSAFYKRQFAKPMQELSTELTYYRFISGEDNELDKQLRLLSSSVNQESVYRLETADNNRNSINFKADYTHPITMDIKFETGTQVYDQQMDFNTTYSYDTRINKYKYNELRFSGYAGITINLGKFGFQTNLRAENSNIDINQNTTDHYFCWLPSANAMYKFNAKNNAKLTYNRRINRPNISQLNPFQKVGLYDDISSGNPLLKPEYRDRFQFTYTLNIDKSYISPYIYHELYSKKVDNYSVFEYSDRVNKQTTVSIPNNLLTGFEQGVGLNAMVMFININFRYYKLHFDEFRNNNTLINARDDNGYSIGGWVYAPLPLKISWFAFANYNSTAITAQGTNLSPFFYGSGMRKELGNHTFGLFYLLPFTPRLTVMKNTVTTPTFTTEMRASFDSKYFIQLSYSYKFNFGKSVKKVNRQVETESDSKKGGLGAGQ